MVNTSRLYPGLERLICAALANPSFATMLVALPAQALENSPFAALLTDEERALVALITDATDIHDYAARLYARIHEHQV